MTAYQEHVICPFFNCDLKLRKTDQKDVRRHLDIIWF